MSDSRVKPNPPCTWMPVLAARFATSRVEVRHNTWTRPSAGSCSANQAARQHKRRLPWMPTATSTSECEMAWNVPMGTPNACALVHVVDREVERTLRDAGLRRRHQQLPLQYRIGMQRRRPRALGEHRARGVGSRQGSPRHRRGSDVRNRRRHRFHLVRHELPGFHADHDAGHRSRAHQLPIPSADRSVRKGRAPRAAAHDRIEHRRRCTRCGEQPRGDDRLDQGNGHESDPELLGDEDEVDQVGSVTTARFREAHGDHPGADQGRPEPGVEAERLGGANPCGRALLLEPRRRRRPAAPPCSSDNEKSWRRSDCTASSE